MLPGMAFNNLFSRTGGHHRLLVTGVLLLDSAKHHVSVWLPCSSMCARSCLCVGFTQLYSWVLRYYVIIIFTVISWSCWKLLAYHTCMIYITKSWRPISLRSNTWRTNVSRNFAPGRTCCVFLFLHRFDCFLCTPSFCKWCFRPAHACGFCLLPGASFCASLIAFQDVCGHGHGFVSEIISLSNQLNSTPSSYKFLVLGNFHCLVL